MDANNSFFVGGLFIKIKIEFPGLSQHFHLDGFLRAPPAYVPLHILYCVQY